MKTSVDYINLLPREERAPSRAADARLAALVVFLLVWAVLFGWKLMERRSLQVKLAALAGQRQGYDQQLTALQQELGLSNTAGANPEKMMIIKNLLGERVLWSEVFKQFSRIVPKGVWFDSLEGTAAAKAEVRIRGGASNYPAVSEFMLAMEKTSFFERPQLMFAQKAVLQGREVVAFEIQSALRPAEGAQR